MKKLFFLSLALTSALSCATKAKEPVDVQAEMDKVSQALKEVYDNPAFSEAQKDSAFHDIILESYNIHCDDSVGLEMFAALASGFAEADEVLALYEDASDLIKGHQGIKSTVEDIRTAQATSEGARYIDVEGPDAISGKTLSISEVLKAGKPVLVDFWASWCRPCRNEISSNLIGVAKKGEVTVLGVAVWENDIEDTRKAMKELGITWNVIFAGGREDSPTRKYGIQGIPTLILIDTDGTIIGRGHSIEDIPYFKK